MPDPNSPVATLDSGSSRGDDVITVYFVPDGDLANFSTLTSDPQADITSDGWTQTEIDRVMAALTTISNYVDLSFEISNAPTADFQMVLDNDELGDPNLRGYFYQPGNDGYTGQTMGVFNATSPSWNALGLQEGGLGFATVIHEALHGLGLDHPHDGASILKGLDPDALDYPFGEYGDFELNQEVYTIMSYNAGLSGPPYTSEATGSPMGPMALDIAILQEYFGENTTYNNVSNIYVLPDPDVVANAIGWLSIWDTGGIDEIRYGGTKDVTIDLRAATLNYEEGGGGFVSMADGVAGGYTIANGVVIENATGGSGNDTLIGNSAANILIGNNGIDTLFGGANDDLLSGGNGNDTISGGTGSDEIDGGANNDTLSGNSGSDDVRTTGGTNTIYGNSGADTLTGGSGVDTIFGSSGDDIISGGGSGDFLYGGRGDDTLSSDGGGDRLNGGMGQDVMNGGAGVDTFVFDFVSDSWAGRRDTINGFEAGDKIDLSGIDANLAVAGDQAFVVLAGVTPGAFTFTAGEIVLETVTGNTVVMVDRDGDTIAEMEIHIAGFTGLTEADFIL